MANFIFSREKPDKKFCVIYRILLAILICAVLFYSIYFYRTGKKDESYEKGVELVDMREHSSMDRQEEQGYA